MYNMHDMVDRRILRAINE